MGGEAVSFELRAAGYMPGAASLRAIMNQQKNMKTAIKSTFKRAFHKTVLYLV